MKKYFFAFIFIFACASTSQMSKPQYVGYNTFDASFDKVWNAVLQVLGEGGFPIGAIEKESGIITTDFVTFTYDVLSSAECPKAIINLLNWKEGQIRMNILVRKINENSTQVTIRSVIMGFEHSWGRWNYCNSTGVIENQIFNAVAKRIQ